MVPISFVRIGGGADVLESDPTRRQRRGIDLDMGGILLLAGNIDLRHAAHRR
jgi:hypothetical protein